MDFIVVYPDISVKGISNRPWMGLETCWRGNRVVVRIGGVSRIGSNLNRILSEIPKGTELVVVAKARQPSEIVEAIAEGARIIGQNYVQEAERIRSCVGPGVQCHLIGHLQSNKVKKAVGLFDMIQTVDSLKSAAAIDRQLSASKGSLPILLEVNVAKEQQKTGLMPEDVEAVATAISSLRSVRLTGLMTMGPDTNEDEETRRYFRAARRLFEQLLKSPVTGIQMKYLSMGMSDSYRIAIDEGANMIRLGKAIFGERP